MKNFFTTTRLVSESKQGQALVELTIFMVLCFFIGSLLVIVDAALDLRMRVTTTAYYHALSKKAPDQSLLQTKPPIQPIQPIQIERQKRTRHRLQLLPLVEETITASAKFKTTSLKQVDGSTEQFVDTLVHQQLFVYGSANKDLGSLKLALAASTLLGDLKLLDLAATFLPGF